MLKSVAACAPLVLLALACTRKAPEPERSPKAQTPPQPEVRAAPSEPEPAKDEPSEPAPDFFRDSDTLPKEVDLDGDGKPERLEAKGDRLWINDAATDIEPSIKVVDLTPTQPGKQIARAYVVEDDDVMLVNVYVYRDGALRKAGEATVNQHYVTVKDGLLENVEPNCNQVRTQRWTLKDDRLVKTVDETRGEFKPEMCAACPYVYVESERGEWLFAGEILRNLRSKELERTQALSIEVAPSANERLRVKLSEEKPETTYLDAIALRSANETFHPVDVEPSLHEVDQQYTVLRQGEALVLTFEGVPAGPAVLEATGYYVPAAARSASTHER